MKPGAPGEGRSQQMAWQSQVLDVATAVAGHSDSRLWPASVALAVLMTQISAVSCVVVWTQHISEEPRAWGFSCHFLL